MTQLWRFILTSTLSLILLLLSLLMILITKNFVWKSLVWYGLVQPSCYHSQRKDISVQLHPIVLWLKSALCRSAEKEAEAHFLNCIFLMDENKFISSRIGHKFSVLCNTLQLYKEVVMQLKHRIWISRGFLWKLKV